MPTIGLTGNFGMGKTTVLGLFKELGAHTYNMDEFVHDILRRESIIRKISGVLGDEVLIHTSTGPSLDKEKMASIIFGDPDRRRAVEGIIHPSVLKEIKTVRSNILKQDRNALIVFEIPLLFEAGYGKHFDKTIVVHSKKQTAINRLKKKGFSKDDILKRYQSQMPIYKKKELADFLIENNGDIKVTSGRVKRICKRLTRNG